ncbi:ubiquinol-cytochrome c reductase cytochrome c1 subunit [Litorimonas taeanensis]|uniref:Cytochrome c1 n=1 Tax=Litorimonas taeanensis TaxID=568099 RepID=A0A420WFL8_9PROT|nr:cytochrome c1 [Litorimonas taeanensis]RKQ69773.1 ubiquinol-cytochrome c reductase cytochrome c1 subunit [Litorimonas taeanensis]
MTSKLLKSLFVAAGAVAVIATGGAFAAGGSSDYKMEHKHWHFNGPFGTYDKAAAQRGYQVYREVCSSCHQLKFLSFRHLGDKGAPFHMEDYPNPNDNPYVKNFAADWTIQDIDSDTGDVIDRPGITADNFPPIYANDAAARASNGGALPPELSVIVKARTGGADYVYNLLTAYDAHKPDDVELTPGLYYNPVMEGGKIAMAAPLSEGIIEYAPTTDAEGNEIAAPEATVEQMAADVTEFLAWSADPKMEQRKGTGIMTMVYLFLLSILLWFSYKRVWRHVEH